MTWSGGAGSGWNGAGTGELSNFNINALGWQHYNHSVNSWVYHNSGSFFIFSIQQCLALHLCNDYGLLMVRVIILCDGFIKRKLRELQKIAKS